MAKPERSDWVYDELLCFLGNPFFQIPVITFMEANCLIFDPNEDNNEEYKKVHSDYKQMVAALLEGFIKDSGLSYEQVLKALGDMNAKSDLREIFQGLFEQVLAMDEYRVFVRLMTQKNIELQQQALLLIVQTTGSLPDILKAYDDDNDSQSKKTSHKKHSPHIAERLSTRQNEDEIMKAILEQSKREYENSTKEKSKEAVKENQMLTTLVGAPNEVHRLEEEKKKEQKKLEKALLSLHLDEPVSVKSHGPSPAGPKSPSKRTSKHRHAKAEPQAEWTQQSPTFNSTDLSSAPTLSKMPSSTSAMPSISVQSKVSSSEAAANWMKSAQSEISESDSHSKAVSAAAIALSKLNPEELRKRQEFLSQQRDKLIAMKKKEREKQLLAAEQSQPQRPMSARAAKSLLNSNADEDHKELEQTKLSPDEEKKIAMRRAIADRLKAELLVPK
ncbi:hypothetical protein ScPMuIL_014009 [Solemya velum]